MNPSLKDVLGHDLGWFSAQAEALDRGDIQSHTLLEELGRRGLFRIAIARRLDGVGGELMDAVEAIAAVAARSLAAGLVFWGHRAFIEYLLASPNGALRERWLAPLLAGDYAGATGLSNVMKYLSGIESVQLSAQPCGQKLRIDGVLPWVSNVQPNGFVVAVAVNRGELPPAIVALTSDQPGVLRGDNLDLIALRGTATARIVIEDAEVGDGEIIHDDANQFCREVRPAFLAMQLGLSIGLARASLEQARARSHQRGAMAAQVSAVEEALRDEVAALSDALQSRDDATDARALFGIRIRLAEVVLSALGLELQATGGRAYVKDSNSGFARRWREAAFIPVLTPSLTQLRGELQRVDDVVGTEA